MSVVTVDLTGDSSGDTDPCSLSDAEGSSDGEEGVDRGDRRPGVRRRRNSSRDEHRGLRQRPRWEEDGSDTAPSRASSASASSATFIGLKASSLGSRHARVSGGTRSNSGTGSTSGTSRAIHTRKGHFAAASAAHGNDGNDGEHDSQDNPGFAPPLAAALGASELLARQRAVAIGSMSSAGGRDSQSSSGGGGGGGDCGIGSGKATRALQDGVNGGVDDEAALAAALLASAASSSSSSSSSPSSSSSSSSSSLALDRGSLAAGGRRDSLADPVYAAQVDVCGSFMLQFY